jgi:hypothetical protein
MREDGGLMLEPDDFDDFVTSLNDPDIDTDNIGGNSEEQHDNAVNEFTNLWDSTNTGEFILEVEGDEMGKKGVLNDITINGHVLLNQCGSLLTRKKHMVKGNKKEKFFLQKLCATSTGTSVPLVYPEATLFSSIFWKSSKDSSSILGAIPSSLLSEESAKSFGFASIPEHVRSRLTNISTTTSSDFHYASFCYDKLTNLAANHQDTRIVIRRGLTVDEKSGGLGLRGTGDTSMLESFDSKAMVRNLCAAQQYHNMTHFLTYTCNMKKHFGTQPIKEWIDSKQWKKYIPYFEDLDLTNQEEIENGINQASSGLLLRVWQEVTQLFLQFIKDSPSSPFINVKSMFTRKEYQKLVGNLHHLHLIMEVNMPELSEEQKQFIQDLSRCSCVDVVRLNEVDKFYNDGTLKDFEDYQSMINDADNFLGHKCNSRCLVKMPNGEFRCRKLNYLEMSKNNNQHTFREFNSDISKDCLDRLTQIGMIEPIEINEHGYPKDWKSKLSFLHPKRHIPPTNPNYDNNMSPVESHTFSNCRSMQNIQVLTQTGGVNKYVCKYIGKIDEQNYVVVKANSANGVPTLLTKSTFLHNTKIASSKMQEDKDRKKDSSYPQGRYISHVEMLHQMLKYPEVITDLHFVTITTTPLEYRAGIELDSFVAPAPDEGQSGSASNDIRNGKALPEWRQHTIYEMRIYEDLTKSSISIDKITLFSLRPPELRNIINKTKNYFRWFHTVLSKKESIKGDRLDDAIDADLLKSYWVNGLQQQVYLRRRAVPELIGYINTLDEATLQEDGVAEMVALFHKIDNLLTNADQLDENNPDDISDVRFYEHMMENLIQDDTRIAAHLPVPVFSYIKPTTCYQFLHHILLSMGSFATEIDLIMKPSLRESFRYAKLIGQSDEPEDLQRYSDNLLYCWIEEQLQYWANSKRLITEWIVIAGELFDGVIVRNELSISDMPPVQLSSLFGSSEEETITYIRSLKNTFIDAIHEELTPITFELCSIPSKATILSASKSLPMNWDAVDKFTRNPIQSEDSFEEQRTAINVACSQIDKYINPGNQTVFTKNVGIRGFPGSGKTWCSLYIAIYGLSKGLIVLPTALLAKRALQLGGTHWHKLFYIPIEKNLGIHRKAELALSSIIRDAKLLHLLLCIDVLICDEIGKFKTFFMSLYNINNIVTILTSLLQQGNCRQTS